MRRTSLALLLSLLVLVPAASAQAQKARKSIVNGTPISVTAAPWQAYVYVAPARIACGGSVLDARRILTAAHCVAGRQPADITVVTGLSAAWTPPGTPPPGAQSVVASGLRVHPYYAPEPYIADDVAVVTLSRALNLATPRTRPIALAGAAPAPGTALMASGYGAQRPGVPPNGRLYAATLSAMSDISCMTSITPNMSAGALCAFGPTGGATCYGDSGGPIVAGGVLVGVTSATAGAAPCTSPWPGLYADVTAPEIRAFIDGSATPPRAPRLADAAGMYAVNPPVVGSPINCAAGTWEGATSLTYTFLNDSSLAPIQSGASATFVPSAAHVGTPVSCAVQAANAGGVSTARTTGAAIQADTVAPRAVLRSVRCRKRRRCTVRLQAADSNSLGQLRVRVVALRRARGWCRKGKGSNRRRVRCTKTKTKRFAVRHVEGVNWIATARRMKRGRATLQVRVTDAAGNKATGRHLKRRIRVK